MTYRISVDTGGTFTDVVVADEAGQLRIGKALTSPQRALSVRTLWAIAPRSTSRALGRRSATSIRVLESGVIGAGLYHDADRVSAY